MAAPTIGDEQPAVAAGEEDAEDNELGADLERSAALRKQVDAVLEAASIRVAPTSVPSSVEKRADALAPSLPPTTSVAAREEQVAASARQRGALLLQADELRRQHESIDLASACGQAYESNSAATARSQRDADDSAERALRKIASLQEDFKEKLRRDGVDIEASLDDLGLQRGNADAAISRLGGSANRYTTVMQGARQAFEAEQQAAH